MAFKSLTGFDANLKTVFNVADGAAANDAVNKSQLDSVIRNVDWKIEVIAASTTNVTLTAPGTTLDGVALTAGMQVTPLGTVTRVLLKDQSAPAENGVWDWNGAAVTMTRSTDSDTNTRLSGSTYTVQRGTVNADRVYRVLTDDPIVLNTTALTFGQIGAASGAYTAGNGIALNSNAFSVLLDASSGLVVSGTGLKIDTSVVTRKISADCVATTNPQTFTHNLNTLDVDVTIREISTGILLSADITVTGVNTLSVNFGGAPTASQYRVITMG